MTNLNYESAESIGERCVIYKVGTTAQADGADACYCAIRRSGSFGSASDIVNGSADQRLVKEISYRMSFLFTDLEPDTTYYLGATIYNGSSYANTRTETIKTLPLAQKVPGIPRLGAGE